MIAVVCVVTVNYQLEFLVLEPPFKIRGINLVIKDNKELRFEENL